jgi:ABC-type Co2+ transport system permease subunit
MWNMEIDDNEREGAAMRGLSRRRLATVALAPAAALMAWGIEKAFGANLVLKDGSSIDASDVFIAAVVGAVAAWLVVWWIERKSRRPRSVWAFVSSTALAVSGIGPSYRADGVTALMLFGLHFVTAVVVIAGFMRTLPARDYGFTHRASGS